MDANVETVKNGNGTSGHVTDETKKGKGKTEKAPLPPLSLEDKKALFAAWEKDQAELDELELEGDVLRGKVSAHVKTITEKTGKKTFKYKGKKLTASHRDGVYFFRSAKENEIDEIG